MFTFHFAHTIFIWFIYTLHCIKVCIESVEWNSVMLDVQLKAVFGEVASEAKTRTSG